MAATGAKPRERALPKRNPDNLASDDGIKAIIASFFDGEERTKKRFSVVQTKLWVLNKAGGGDFIRPIINRGVAMPADGPQIFSTRKMGTGTFLYLQARTSIGRFVGRTWLLAPVG